MIEAADAKQDTLPGTGRSSAPVEPPSLPGADRGATGDERSFDKPDDKQDDKRIAADPALAKAIESWPDLPEVVQKAILAMVEASVKPQEDRRDQ